MASRIVAPPCDHPTTPMRIRAHERLRLQVAQRRVRVARPFGET
jgi:hypothetical protein